MRERRPGEIGVEQRHYAAGARDAEPDRHVFGAVRHQQANGLALGEALAAGPAGVAVGALAELAIAQPLASREQRRRVAEFLREFLDHDGEDPGRILGDRRRHPERAQNAPQVRDVALEPLDQAHRVSLASRRRFVCSAVRRRTIGERRRGGKRASAVQLARLPSPLAGQGNCI